MANTKIDRIKLNGSDTVYDIDLPPDATPSISSLTVSGIKSAAMVSTDANGKLTKSNLPASFTEISYIKETHQYNDNIEVTEIYLQCEGMEGYVWSKIAFMAPNAPAASTIKYYYNYMGQKTQLTPTNASSLNNAISGSDVLLVSINNSDSNPTITYIGTLTLGQCYYSTDETRSKITYYMYNAPFGMSPALREISPDTHFTTGLYVGKVNEKSNSATTNGNTYLKLFDNDTKRAQHLINGGGATMVTSNASGTIEIATPIKTLDTTSGSGLGAGSENIAGSGTIYLHKVAKTGKLTDLSDRTFSNISSRGEEYLEWGGPAKSGEVSPIGVAMSLEHSANRLALINHDALTFEYSSDGGTTWTAYSYKGTEKTKFCTSYLGLPIGRPDESTNLVANKSKTRITITAQTGTAGYVYVSLRKLLVNVASATTLSMLLERRTGANYKSNGAWETIGTYSLKGWSGWNDIPLSSHLGGGNTQTSNYWQMRMTITCTTVSTTNPKTGQVRGIRIFGENCWISASTLAETGHLYSYNMAGHATFPGNVYANGFYATGTISTTNGSVSGLSFIEGGKKLLDKYLYKGSASTNDNQVVYNPVEMKKALTVPSVQGTKYTDNSGNQQSMFTLGGTVSGSGNTSQGSSSLTLYRNRAGSWDSATISFTPADGLKIGNYSIGVQNWDNVPASYILTNGDGVTKDRNGGVKLKSSGGASSDDFVFESTNNGKLHSKMSIGPSGLVRGGWCIDNSKIITEATLGSAVGSISSESIVSICI